MVEKGNKFIGLVLKILPLENSLQEKVTLCLALIGLSIYLIWPSSFFLIPSAMESLLEPRICFLFSFVNLVGLLNKQLQSDMILWFKVCCWALTQELCREW